jgi:hypothetical protein
MCFSPYQLENQGNELEITAQIHSILEEEGKAKVLPTNSIHMSCLKKCSGTRMSVTDLL